MNKKQEALRRGLRSFIEDTSKELADLEGRPLRSPENPTDTEQVDASAAVVGAEPERAAPAGVPRDGERDAERVERPRPEAQSGPGPAPPPPAAPPTPVAPVHASDPGRAARTADGTARVSDGVARASAAAGAVSIPQPPKASPGPASSAPEPRPPLTEPPEATPHAAPTPAVTREESPPAQAERPKHRGVRGSRRGPKAPVRRRSRPAAEIGADGVSPAQVHARKGVCFAYFLNHECWRVADAYCNSALQVCITRECPIYHLHKDALERRFAKKFKHFW